MISGYFDNSLNIVILVGRLGGDPQARYTPSGKMVTNISLATTHKWKAVTGDKKEDTTWHSVDMWGEKQGEVLAKYFHKGDLVCVVGSISKNKDNEGKIWVKIIATAVTMLLSKKGTVESGSSLQGDAADDSMSNFEAVPCPPEDENIPF